MPPFFSIMNCTHLSILLTHVLSFSQRLAYNSQKMEEDDFLPFGGAGKMINWFPNLLESQVDLIANTFTSFLTTSPAPPTNSLAPTSAQPKLQHPSAAAIGPSSDIVSTTQKLVRRVGHGLLGAVYAGMVLSLVMVVAMVIGIVLVNQWVEQPVVVRQKLHFDYTDANPEALFLFGDKSGVPVAHTMYVSVALLVPDSDYNRDIGVFQLMAEVISTNGKLLARSSQPSMLQFQSHSIRLMRTLILGFPYLLGITRETQTITVQMLNYKEDSHLRTGAIKITLLPRAGTSYLPQLYEAEILMHSKLPRMKELIYNWRWTFYVWTSTYIYILLLILLICFFKPLLVFPVLKASGIGDRREDISEREQKPEVRMPDEREFSESLRKWQQYRRKRKATLLSKNFTEDFDSTSASSYTITKEDMGPGIEEDVTDSESVCKGG